MCELLGISANRIAPAEGMLRAFRPRGGAAADNPDGWGLAWWDEDGLRIAKEPEPAARSAEFDRLCAAVRSPLVIAHVRKARFPPVNTMANTHPFARGCCGRQWAFAHNGLVPGIVDVENAGANPVCRPAGETDSEHAFCHLLGHLSEAIGGAGPCDPAAWFLMLAGRSEKVASFGKFNFLLSDGEYLIAYGHDRLHHLEHDGVERGTNARASRALVATEPLAGESGWIAFEPGELRVYRLGRLAGRLLTRPLPVAQ